MNVVEGLVNTESRDFLGPVIQTVYKGIRKSKDREEINGTVAPKAGRENKTFIVNW